jgi:diguanylate cyclase (GGDEF)-like protein/PAS domain S-box-containing protein
MMRLRGVAGPLGLWLLVMAALGVMVARGQDQERDALLDRFQSRADTGAGFVTAYVEDVFRSEERLFVALARSESATADFADLAAMQGFSAAVLLDRDGRAVAFAPAAPDLNGTELASKYAHLGGALGGTPSVSDVVPSAVEGEPVVAFALPVTSERFAVMSGAFSLTEGPLASFLERQPIPGTRGLILDSTGEVVASSDAEAAPGPSLGSGLPKSSSEPMVIGDRVVATHGIEGTGWTYALDAPRAALLAPGSSNDVGEWVLLGAAAVLSLAGLLFAQQAKGDRHEARLAKDQLDRRLRLTLENAPVGMTLVDLRGRLVEPNRRLSHMLGYSLGELSRLTVQDVTHADDLPLDEQQLAELVAGEIPSYELEKRFVRRDGSLLWGRLTVSVLRDKAGARAYLVTQVEDITEVRKARADLQHRALYDPLTGLANRALLMDRLTVALGNQRHPIIVGAGFCDLDHFKVINDTYGHHVGDEVLKEVAKRLQESVRKDDTVARLGGDEFVLLLHDLTSFEDATSVLDRASRAVREPIVVEDVTVRTSLSGGLAVAGPGTDPDLLLRDADAAMYAAKKLGGDRTASAPTASDLWSLSQA